MDFIPVILFWILLLAGMFGRGPFIFYLLFASMPFGSMAVIPPELTSGLSFTAPPIVALAIILCFIGGKGGLSQVGQLALRPSQLLLLFLFWIVAVLTTFLMPRIFAGLVSIIPMRLEEVTTGIPLQPTQQNISQMMYLTISILTVFACALAFRARAIRQHVLAAICLGGLMVVLTGLLDLAGQYVPIEPLLAIFRTATYAYLTDVEIANVRRIVGLMPEASAYGGLAVSFLSAIYFFRRAITSTRLRLYGAPCLVVLLALFAFLSTSSAAYAGLVVFACVAALEWCWRLVTARPGSLMREGLSVEFWTIISGLAVVYLVAVLNPSAFDPLVTMIDTIVLKKTSSDSFEERSMWTAVSWKALMDTYGLGVGMGATRASNGVVAVFSNSGILGGLLYYGFMLQTVLRRAAPGDSTGAAMASAVRFSVLPGFVISIVSGTSADFGVMNACVYAIAVAVSWPGSSRSVQRPAHEQASVRRPRDHLAPLVPEPIAR